MAVKKLATTMRNAAIAGLAVDLMSFVIGIVPCRTYFETSSSFGFCAIQSPLIDITDASTKFYGFSNNPVLALIVQFLIGFIIYLIISTIIRKRKSKVIDLTKK